MIEVKVNELSKAYWRNWALHRVSFTIGTGITGLLGPNGAGKTTLLNILATLLEPTSGQASIGAFDVVRQRQEVRKLLGFLPQDYGLYNGLTVYEFLDYMSILKGLKNRQQCIQRSLDQVGLENCTKKRIGTLSGGMRQRLGIAQALLNTPPVLLVDEPTVGLDPAERNHFRQILTQLASDHTVILSTHLVEDVAMAASRVIVLHSGYVRFNGTVSDLVHSAQGKVWSAKMPHYLLDAIRQHCFITHLEPSEDGYLVRFLSDTPPSLPANLVSPTLEDAYLHLIQESS